MSKIPPYFPFNKAVCVANTMDNSYGWSSEDLSRDVVGPKYNEIVNIVSIYAHKGEWVLHLLEYPDPEGFHAEWFKPLQDVVIPTMTFEKIKETEKEQILIPN